MNLITSHIPVDKAIEVLGKAAKGVIANLDGANDAQKVLIGQQQALLNVATGAVIGLAGVIIAKRLDGTSSHSGENGDDEDVIDISR